MPTLSKDSWHARLYDWTYAKTPPKNLCPYFWAVVFAFPAVLLFWPMAKVFKWIDPTVPTGRGDWITSGVILWIPSALSLGIGLPFLSIILNRGLFWHEWFFAFCVGSVVIAIIAGGWFMGGWAVRKFSDRKKTNGESLVGAKYRAAKDKVCPQINWTDAD